MKRKRIYTPPTVHFTHMDSCENILQSSLGSGDSNSIGLSDEEFDAVFRSNRNVWDLD